MSECQKWPHIQTITKLGVPLCDCWEKMPWCQYWQGRLARQQHNYIFEWLISGGSLAGTEPPPLVPWCHHTSLLATTTLGSGLKGWVRPPPHLSTSPVLVNCPLQTIVFVPWYNCLCYAWSLLSVAPHIVYLVIISLSLLSASSSGLGGN